MFVPVTATVRGLAAILVILLFITALVRIDVAWALAIIFIGCLAAVIASLIISFST